MRRKRLHRIDVANRLIAPRMGQRSIAIATSALQLYSLSLAELFPLSCMKRIGVAAAVRPTPTTLRTQNFLA